MAVARKIKNSVKNALKNGNNGHVWQFSSIGGVNRVNLMSGEDLLNLDKLDQKLWAALSCPVDGLEIDSATLKLIDTDNDDRIRVPEVIAAVKWITSVVKNPDDLLLQKNELPLSAIDDKSKDGKILLASAKQILKNLGLGNQTTISVNETSDRTRIFANTKLNGDGIIIEESTDDADLSKVISQIIACIGSTEDLSGKPGINAEHINSFYQQCEDFAAWQKIAEDDYDNIMPFGDKTAEALTSIEAVRIKIDDYFLRCRLADYDSDSVDIINVQTAQYSTFSSKNLSTCTSEIADLPIAKMDTKKGLPLFEGVNPSWFGAVDKFRELVVNQLFKNKKYLTENEWEEIKSKFNSYTQWLNNKKGELVESLGVDTVKSIIENNKKNELLNLIEQDLALETETSHIFEVDKLVRFYCDIFTLLKNYVNFSDFYDTGVKSIFQAGSLYIDQRCCDLCIKVSDMGKHSSMAGFSDICLVYCDCISKARNEKMTIVAALTDGDNDNLVVGRNAVFYDREGNDWDATITKIVDNPISIRQAFWSPYKKVSRFIGEQVEKFASSKEDAMLSSAKDKVSAVGQKVSEVDVTSTVSGATPAPKAAPAPFDIAKFAGIFAALSMAFGAIGSFIVAAVGGFLKLLWWQMPLAIVGIILIISLPSMLLAYLKLRKRNLAPVLDANGWAINARLNVNIIFGRTLTHLATLPDNSKVNLIDPFKKKQNPLIYIALITVALIAIATVVLWYLGFITQWYNMLFA
ncbi:hypothetical protein MASR2M117_04800 [Paludibacter sp.]